jgi:molybdate transport system substrate-binding protein
MSPSMPAVEVLSAGSIEPGLVAVAAACEAGGGPRVEITWATTPAIRRLVAEGRRADVLIVSQEAMREFARQDLLDEAHATLVGHVGVGVVVRAGAPVPDVGTTDALKRALLDAESVVYNRASSGLYVESLIVRLGIAGQLAPKTVRFDNGPAQMEHLMTGAGRVVGLGAVVEILMFRPRLVLAGPLPAQLQFETPYYAAPMKAAAHPAAAAAFTRHLAEPVARALFAAHGIH